ncbi:MAG: hypothetical protein WBP79_14900 [Candidatus Acidiferrales bacterium]
MRKAVLGGVAVFVLATLVWAGGDPWKTKPFSQWTEKDLQAIFQTSPWAKANVQAAGAWRPMGSETMSGPTPGAIAGSSTDNSKQSQGSLGEQMGGVEKQKKAEESSATQVYTMLWWSSRTVRAASVRRAVLKGNVTEEDAEKVVSQIKDEYEILVQAQNMYIFQHRGEKAFEKVCSIEMKKTKLKLSPTHVKFQRSGDGETVVGVVFYFPKKQANGEPTISADEKEIDFFLQVGDARLNTYFEPKKMVDIQGQDL